MNKPLKKILVTGASFLMMVGVSASMDQVMPSHTAIHASRTVSIPSRYLGTWRGNETQRGRADTFTMKLGRHNGYYRSSRYDKGPVVYTKCGKSFRRMGLRYYYWPEGMVHQAAPCGFGLHGHTLHVSEDTTIWYLHRTHHHYRKYAVRHARHHVRRHGHRSHRRY